MANFQLVDVVDELTYDFKPYSGSGTIPEPSSHQIMDFRKSLTELILSLTKGIPGEDDPTPAQLADAVVSYLGQDSSELDEKMLHAAAAVCSDRPSFDELSLLPYRPRQAFLGWLTGIFLLPEQLRLATKS